MKSAQSQRKYRHKGKEMLLIHPTTHTEKWKALRNTCPIQYQQSWNTANCSEEFWAGSNLSKCTNKHWSKTWRSPCFY